MDLPSVDTAVEIIGADMSDMSDASSLTDTPASFMDIGEAQEYASLPNSDFDFNELVMSYERFEDENSMACLAALHLIPLLEKIAVYLSDSDLYNLSLVNKAIAVKLVPENSGTWKSLFLTKYDYPFVESPYEFCVAYRLRRRVLRQFPSYDDGSPRAEIGLEVLRDMVLETYNQPQAWRPAPIHSRNLAAFSAMSTSPWMLQFFRSPFFAHNESDFGKPNDLFDALQLITSHLILNVRSPFAMIIPTSRLDYDIAKVYLWNLPFETFYRRLPEKGLATTPRATRSLFPKLNSPNLEPEMQLDLHSLLHIRNFWRRHFNTRDDNTYWRMAQDLVGAGKIPQKWERALIEPLILETNWAGHYSCVHNWPKKSEELEEVQSCAQDWNDAVDPLCYMEARMFNLVSHPLGSLMQMLEFSITSSATIPDDKHATFWPRIFSTIPAFAKTVPSRRPDLEYTYIRGMAQFHDLSTPPNTFQEPVSKKYHPFTSLRLRGLVHPIPNQAASTREAGYEDWEVDRGIPGWNRITMVLYKPKTHYLVGVFETACGEFGSPFQQEVAAKMVADGVGSPNTNPKVFAERLAAYLERQVRILPGPVRLNRSLVEKIEDAFNDGMELSWEDVDYAYAYEGILIPGGKIMLGRWWQISEHGTGEGNEFGGADKGERGPWIFWC